MVPVPGGTRRSALGVRPTIAVDPMGPFMIGALGGQEIWLRDTGSFDPLVFAETGEV